MFDISDLKAKKLAELQEIANSLNVPKFKTLKKDDLVYQILDVQAANPKILETKPSQNDASKPKRARIAKSKAPAPTSPTQSAPTPAPRVQEKMVRKEKPQPV